MPLDYCWNLQLANSIFKELYFIEQNIEISDSLGIPFFFLSFIWVLLDVASHTGEPKQDEKFH